MILAIDTSNASGSVALGTVDGPQWQCDLPAEQRNARTLAPAVADLLAQAQLIPQQLTAVAVSRGPGSFTGLRIGVTFAKTFAWAAGIPLIAIDTTLLIAEQARSFLSPEHSRVVVAIDALRQQLFVAEYEPLGTDWKSLVAPRLADAKAWLAEPRPEALHSGPLSSKVLAGRTAAQVWAPETVRRPRAATLLKLSSQAMERGEIVDPFQLTPLYLRPSYAEENATQ